MSQLSLKPLLAHLASSSTLLLASAMCDASVRIGGIVSATHAVQTTDTEAQRSEVTVLPQLEWRSAWGIDLTAIGRLRTDWQNQLEPGEPEQFAVAPWSQRAFVGAYTELELRELYLEVYPFDSYLKLGKQQIVWGQTDGLKVLDRVNPQRYRAFVLEDFETSRIPLWAAKWEFSLDKVWDGQLLFIPDQTYHEVPAAGAIYTPTSSELVVTSPADKFVTGYTRQKPDRLLADADTGMQLSTRKRGWDLTLNYLYHYADTPVIRLIDRGQGIHLNSTYERTHTIGGSASNAFGDFTIRTEMAYATDRYIQSVSSKADQGVIKGGEFTYALGVDWIGLSDTLVSVQLFQSGFDRAGIPASRDTVETDATLLLERSFFNEVLTLRQLLIQDVDTGDGLLSLECNYDYLANLELRLEANIFYGRDNGRYGQFDSRDHILVGIEYGF